jgi:hypothetical protein
LNELQAKHGVIDVNHLSEDIKQGLAKAGLGVGDLEKIAGPDGQIKGSEFQKLYDIVERFDSNGSGLSFVDKDAKTKDLTVAGELHKALAAEVERNRGLAQYGAPGKSIPLQKRLTEADAYKPPAGSVTTVDLKMKGINQFDLENGSTACYRAAYKQCTEYNNKTHKGAAPELSGPEGTIQVAYAEDKEGRVAVDKTQAKIGRDYIDKCLDAQLPVLVGVSYSDESYNNDRMTDHFVSIYGRGVDASGRQYYDFKDPGDGGRTGRLYVDKDTGTLFKEGSLKTGYVRDQDYQITQVRTYKNAP